MAAYIEIVGLFFTFVAGSLVTASSERCGRGSGTTQHLSPSRLSRQVRASVVDPGLLGVDPDPRICYSGSVSDNPTLDKCWGSVTFWYGSALLTNGSGCWSGRPENIRIRIRNTGTFTCGSPTLLDDTYLFFTCGPSVDECEHRFCIFLELRVSERSEFYIFPFFGMDRDASIYNAWIIDSSEKPRSF
jgi:hypothetical protein